MRKFLSVAGLLTIASLLFAASCKKTEEDAKKDDNGLDRKALLTNYTNNYIIPAYGQLEVNIERLQVSSAAFIATPDETTLATLKDAWRSAYRTWQKTELLEFGPAEDVSLRMYMNTYPVTTSKVEANITSGSYNLEEFGNKDAQGFPALDYLLNAQDAQVTIALYTTNAQAAARKQYLKAIVDKMDEKVTGVKNAWATYKDNFTESTGTDVNGGLSKLTNAYVLYFERYLRSGKIGLPVGAMTGTAKPELTESFYSPELANELAAEALKAAKNFYEGKSFDGQTTGDGLKSYLAAIGTKDDNGTAIADLISKQFDGATQALTAVNTPLRTAVQNDRLKVLALYDELQEIVPLIKVDMVSAFGISITYVDNDGD